MESTAPAIPKPKQPLYVRAAFFVIGGVASVLLNKGIMGLLEHRLGWPEKGAFAVSVCVTAVVFFCWSYFVNFRTSVAWKDCLPKYLTVLVFTNFLNYLIGLTGFHKFGSKGLTGYLVIGVVYSFTGCLKFVLYNNWVFPHGGKGSPPSAS
jgi:hypothetical protein